MSDEVVAEWTSFRRARWGPVHVRQTRYGGQVDVGGVSLTPDLHDRRSVAEVRAEPFRSPFVDGVPILIDGEQVATLTRPAGSPLGIIRRERLQLEGGEPVMGERVHLALRGLPSLLTLRDRSGWLVTSSRAREPLNVLVREYSIIRDRDVLRPRVSKRARPEHIALWFAVKNFHSS